jgi:protein transport protein DSL1/ZW10
MLMRSRYLAAAGSVVDATLVRVLEDITALPDIPAVESHQLSELCRILNALEGLFVEGPDQVTHLCLT